MSERYKILLKSREGHGYEYQCYATSKEDAGQKALDILKEIGYDRYGYTIQEVTSMKH